MSRRLSELSVGSAGVIARVLGARPVRRRLMELGLVPGTAVAVINVAPLGDPLELEVRGCKLSIRHAEAGTIELEASTSTAADHKAEDRAGSAHTDARARRHLKVRQ